MRVAAIQMRSGVSISENCDTFSTMVRKAAADGAQYVQTPEMTGILQRSRRKLFDALKPESEDLLVQLAGTLSRELGIWLHVGSQAIRLSDDRAANRGFLFSPQGEIRLRYDKIHMFDVDLDNGESWRESKVYQAGGQSFLTTVCDVPTGISICYDIRFPHLYREQALAGAKLLTAPASFTRQTGTAHWHVLMRARAIENGAFVIAAAQGGVHEDGRETYGHSLIVNPWGEIVAECPGDEPGIIVADLDFGEVDRARAKIPNLANGRHFVLETISDELDTVSNEAAE